MDEWNIQSRGHLCATCQTAFVDKQTCFTILSVQNSQYLRQDLCAACWDGTGGPMIREKAGVISYWHGIYEPPAPPPPDPLPKEDAESLLRKMMERNDPSEMETKYILAVMLERKKILKHRETQKNADRILVYEHAKTGETLVVKDPQLRLDQLEEVQRRVFAMLKPAPQQTEAVVSTAS
jgi:hypothetical protein